LGDAVRGQGKTRGAFGFALNFFAPLFLSREKVGKDRTKEMIERVKTPTAMLRQAQHDKAQETLQIVINLKFTLYGYLKKLICYKTPSLKHQT
jgi:hypothetical protein